MNTDTVPMSDYRQKTLHAHKLVYECACKMAEELYDMIMVSNDLYAHWKKSCENEFQLFESEPAQKRFVELIAPKLLEEARKTLATLLGQPSTPDAMKVEIHDALVKDYSLKRGRTVKKRLAFRP